MTVANVTDPNGEYPIKAGAFVGFDYSTTALRGGVMLVASPNGKDKIPKLSPDGQFLFNQHDGDNVWILLKDKVQSVLGNVAWDSIAGKPDVATKADVATVSEVANNALNKANSNETALAGKVNKTDLTWDNISDKPGIPDTDATTIVSSGDLNNYVTTGKYYMPNPLSSYTNHPSTGGTTWDWFVMKADSYHGGDMVVQTIYQVNSDDIWVRQRWVNDWKAWRQVTFWPKGG